MKKAKIKLRVQPIYSTVIYYVLGLVFIFFIFMPALRSWKSSGKVIEIIYYLVFSLFSAFCFVQGTLYIQFAEIDGDTLVVKDLFHTIATVKWGDICSVKKEKVLTYNSRAHVSLEWIVIKTDAKQEICTATYNKKGTFPLLIIATQKNVSMLSEYIKIE